MVKFKKKLFALVDKCEDNLNMLKPDPSVHEMDLASNLDPAHTDRPHGAPAKRFDIWKVNMNEWVEYPQDSKRSFIAAFKRIGWLRSQVKVHAGNIPEGLGDEICDTMHEIACNVVNDNFMDCKSSQMNYAAIKIVAWDAGIKTRCPSTDEPDGDPPPGYLD